MSGIAVPERVHGTALAQAGTLDDVLNVALDAAAAEVAIRFMSGEEPGSWPVLLPVDAQFFEQPAGQRHQPIFGSFAVADVDDHALTIDVTHLKLDQFT